MYETNTKSVNQKIQWEFSMMTPGDKRWIKNWKPKGVNMNPTKKRQAKRKVVSAEYFAKRNPVLSKILDLKYRINEAYRNGADDAYNDTRADKSWVMKQIEDIRNGRVLSKNNMLKANDIWKRYNKYETKSI